MSSSPPEESSEQTAGSSRNRDVLTVAIVAIIALMLGVNLFMFIDDSPDRLVDEQAPGFELPIKDQEATMSLADKRGQVVLMEFWASWCVICQQQLPVVEAVANDPELGDEVVAMSINTDVPGDDRMADIEEFLEAADVSLPTLLDDGSVQAAYNAGALPTMVVVDPDGYIFDIKVGTHDETMVRQLVEEAAR